MGAGYMVGIRSYVVWIFYQYLFPGSLVFATTFHNDPSLFRIEWSPLRGTDNPQDLDKGVLVSTKLNEHYYCTLPREGTGENSDSEENASGTPSPAELVQHQINVLKQCTYRIEMYWTYELCHGRFLRQFHEEKHASSKEGLQEYYLGHYVPEEALKLLAEKSSGKAPPTRKIEDKTFPYIPVRYTQGTMCDINNQPRMTTVLYMCLPGHRGWQFFSVDEVSSCEYEAIVFTAALCAYPMYTPQERVQKTIRCSSVADGTPNHPKAYDAWKREMAWPNNQYGIFPTVFGTHGQTFKVTEKPATPEHEIPQPTVRTKSAPPPSADTGLSKDFLSGAYCLYGGTGWWKHEYCHGKQVIQFHEDPKNPQEGRTEVLLGVWNHAEHVAWLKAHPHKRPIRDKGTVLQVSHYYGHGDMCPGTRKSRFVEVRLRCRNSAGSPNSVTLYLMEPKTCEYILGVESQMLCDVIQTADDDAMFFDNLD